MTKLHQSQLHLVATNFTVDKIFKKVTSRSQRSKNLLLASSSGRNLSEEVTCEQGHKEWMKSLTTEMKSWEWGKVVKTYSNMGKRKIRGRKESSAIQVIVSDPIWSDDRVCRGKQ